MVTGCTHVGMPLYMKYFSWRDHCASLPQEKYWNLSGTLSITHHKTRNLTHFVWKQRESYYVINISDPLNISEVRIVNNANGVTFWQTKKKCIKAKTPEELIADQLGWQLPISNIRYWMLACPAPGRINRSIFDQYGHLISFEQDGWLIRCYRFKTSCVKYVDLPDVIEIKNHNIVIKIKIIGYSHFIANPD